MSDRLRAIPIKNAKSARPAKFAKTARPAKPAKATKPAKMLDMGKSCVRFKKLEDLPLDVIGDAIGRVSAKDDIAKDESILGDAAKRRR